MHRPLFSAKAENTRTGCAAMPLTRHTPRLLRYWPKANTRSFFRTFSFSPEPVFQEKNVYLC